MLNLKERRKQLKISQIEMASWLGISRMALINIENGSIPSGYYWDYMSCYYELPYEMISLEYQKMKAEKLLKRSVDIDE